MRLLKPNQLYCFSPPVMLATFLIEVAGALYVFYRYRLTKPARVAVTILTCLAIFQLAEYNVCEGAFGISSFNWARIGYVAITLLPPLGIHLGMSMAKQKNSPLLLSAYGSAVLFAGYFLTIGHGMSGSQCVGNYVIFDMLSEVGWLYALYYYGWLITGASLAWRLSKSHKKLHVRQALSGLLLGYLGFLIPTTTVNLMNPATIDAIPSIMCGFAVLLALVLVMYVLPVYYRRPVLAASLLERLPFRSQNRL